MKCINVLDAGSTIPQKLIVYVTGVLIPLHLNKITVHRNEQYSIAAIKNYNVNTVNMYEFMTV